MKIMRPFPPEVAFAACVLLGACNRSVPVAAPRTVASSANPPPQSPKALLLAPADVDARLRAAWHRAGVTPAAPAKDAIWLRRAWLDVLGTIPPPDVTERFLSDPAPNPRAKKARAIDEMLASPHWAEHWTAYWDEVWMGRGTRAPDIDRGAFRAWIHDRFSRNAPWDTIVTELLTATGINSAGGPQPAALANEGNTPLTPGVNGAVNWTLKYRESPQDMAGSASRTLLGIQIQCAQCHDHKTERWTQRDFQSFAAAFVRTRLLPIGEGDPMGQVKRVEVTDLDRPAPRLTKMGDLRPIASAPPTALDGTSLEGDGGVRATLARWVTSPNNPWFAHAFVNRMWGHFLGRGFVDPVDDLRPTNPPSAPELYDALATDFAASGFDVQHLVRLIVSSEAYGLSAAPLTEESVKADPDAKLWQRFRITPLGPEELLNALIAATGLDTVVRATDRLDLDQIRFRVKQRYGFLFDVDEEGDMPDYAGTIAQALALLNGSVVTTGTSLLPGSALAAIVATPGDDATKLDALYVRTLSRRPTPEETTRWTQFIADAGTAPTPAHQGAGQGRPPDPLGGLANRAANRRTNARDRALEDLLWVLLNSSEFVFNH